MADDDLKRELEEAEDRARRANERAREAEEGYRKLQMDIVTAKDETQSLRDELAAMSKKLVDLEAARSSAARQMTGPPPPTLRQMTGPPAPIAPVKSEAEAQVEQLLKQVKDLREMLAVAANELSQLHADEVVLSAKRTRILGDACALLSRAVGTTGEAPPPIPNLASRALEARLTVHPVVDISEVAELLAESLRPPSAPSEG